MDEITLTPEATDVLTALCKEYRKRVKHGMPKSDAANFDSSKTIHRDMFPKWPFADVDEACTELWKVGLLDGFRADGYLYQASLSDAGISFNQYRTSKTVSTFFGLLKELVQAILSLWPS